MMVWALVVITMSGATRETYAPSFQLCRYAFDHTMWEPYEPRLAYCRGPHGDKVFLFPDDKRD